MPKEISMCSQLAINGGAFGAYIARPAALPAPGVVVLHEVFGVNADIRKTCDELVEQGFIAVAPDLFWRQEPGVDLEQGLQRLVFRTIVEGAQVRTPHPDGAKTARSVRRA